jgi:hypothetical protein
MDNALNQTHERESRMFRDQLVTVGDFLDMKDQLLAELKKILKSPGTHAAQKWLKAFEVRGSFYKHYDDDYWQSPNGTPYRNWKVLATDWIFNHQQDAKLRQRQIENRTGGL